MIFILEYICFSLQFKYRIFVDSPGHESVFIAAFEMFLKLFVNLTLTRHT